eukprot:CAMPEP_0202895362 /NCGR_PEP_ID=MMETSP1392-20130828/4589_1 /ASSEMBLY_ACC=CAM_ASM_000868 /TAXON_ID=225041 /ORGANISM="Chlamydomonas chlamydogama, Strain SAG 11-48b" /LENGTH=460 /DNA_ID=CAMNT_0049580351 /DNA_START=59 /DNA_END=1441 /DNA_ORIENTATION=+
MEPMRVLSVLSTITWISALLGCCLSTIAARKEGRGLANVGSTVQRRVLLYVWTGAEGNSETDFLFTVDVTHPDDPSFGAILAQVDAPYENLEPHHIGLSADNKVLGTGSYNSFLAKSKYGAKTNPPPVLFWDVDTDPVRPKFIKGAYPYGGAVTDDVARLSNNGFLVSLMGNSSGGTPGRILEVSPYNWTTKTGLEVVAEYLPPPGERDTFNPHGLLLLGPPINRFLNGDLMDYASALWPGTYATSLKRSTLRVWDLPTRTLLKTVDVGRENSRGIMKVQTAGPPGSTKVLFNTGIGWIWAMDVITYEYRKLLDINRPGGETGHCVFSTPFKGGTRILFTSFGNSRIFLLNVTEPFAATILQEHKLPDGAGPHAIAVHPDANTFAVTDYYLKTDTQVGGVNFNQDRKVRLFRIAADGNSFTPHERVPYLEPHKVYKKTKGGARPHGMAFKVVNLTVTPHT